jgi:Mitochondrial ribosomal protein (VAR1)
MKKNLTRQIKSSKFYNFKYNKYNPSVNEWKNSIYTYNNNFLNFSIFNTFIFDVFNSYFNKKLFLSLKKKVYSLNRIYISIPDIKYSINYINICIYIFNKERLTLLYNLYRLEGIKFKTKKFTKNLSFNKSIIDKTKKKFKPININKLIISKPKNNNILLNNSKVNKFININIVHDICNKNLYKIYLYKMYISRLYFNKFKFNFINFINLRRILHIFFLKNININIINLKYLHLDNDIYIDGVVRKLKDRRRNALSLLRRAYVLAKIPFVNSMVLLRRKNYMTKIIYSLSSYNEFIKNKEINKFIFETLKSTHLVGMRLEGKGRLTRRLTASRAVLKRTYVGNLKNIFSSFQGLSSTTIKGFQRSNVDYTNHNSYNNNGSFGIKSWHNTF